MSDYLAARLRALETRADAQDQRIAALEAALERARPKGGQMLPETPRRFTEGLLRASEKARAAQVEEAKR